MKVLQEDAQFLAGLVSFSSLPSRFRTPAVKCTLLSFGWFDMSIVSLRFIIVSLCYRFFTAHQVSSSQSPGSGKRKEGGYEGGRVRLPHSCLQDHVQDLVYYCSPKQTKMFARGCGRREGGSALEASSGNSHTRQEIALPPCDLGSSCLLGAKIVSPRVVWVVTGRGAVGGWYVAVGSSMCHCYTQVRFVDLAGGGGSKCECFVFLAFYVAP